MFLFKNTAGEIWLFHCIFEKDHSESSKLLMAEFDCQNFLKKMNFSEKVELFCPGKSSFLWKIFTFFKKILFTAGRIWKLNVFSDKTFPGELSAGIPPNCPYRKIQRKPLDAYFLEIWAFPYIGKYKGNRRRRKISKI